MNPLDVMVADYNCEYFGIPRILLMENAGKSIADFVIDKTTYDEVVIFAGSGGNGGDGFVAARHLLSKKCIVKVILLAPPSKIKSPDALTNWKIIERLSKLDNPIDTLELYIVTEPEDLDHIKLFKDSIIIDAILGTGVKGELREPIRSAIEKINKSKSYVVSVDIPSGLDPLTGDLTEDSIKPNTTITFHGIKKGLNLAKPNDVGTIRVADIGIPKVAEFYVGDGDLLRLKKRDEYAHKGDNGKILIIGGNAEYSGAPTLAGLSALATGADLVTIISPESAASMIKKLSPDLIVKSTPGDHINHNAINKIIDSSKNVDTILIGCGLGQHPETKKVLNDLLEKWGEQTDFNMVLDADALKLVDYSLINNNENLIVTPHTKEFENLFNMKFENGDIFERFEAVDTIDDFKGAIILKGKTDVICQQGRYRFNDSGSPRMTVGGTGDCLAGITASLVSQKNSIFDSALLAAFINGKAGELAEEELGLGFKASDLIKYIPKAMTI